MHVRVMAQTWVRMQVKARGCEHERGSTCNAQKVGLANGSVDAKAVAWGRDGDTQGHVEAVGGNVCVRKSGLGQYASTHRSSLAQYVGMCKNGKGHSRDTPHQ
ncbi:hypothetical protein SLA2020_193180 [Shorea laevis]